MKILVTGSHGLIGSALINRLEKEGHKTYRLVRQTPEPGTGQAFWSPSTQEIDLSACGQLDAAVHLAGENIASGRWTAARMARIRRSRIDGTRLLVSALAALDPPPRVLVSASAIGIYGDRGDEPLTERSAPGKGFLSELCREWEEAAAGARRAGIRTVNFRIGLVLSPTGGALAKMLLPFRLGLGGRVGSGHQYMSWIVLDDLVSACVHCIEQDGIDGPLNAVAPHPVTNREFTKALGTVLGRPTFLPLPARIVRLLLGRMADELLLAGARVEPALLNRSGFNFEKTHITEALRSVIS